MVTTVSSAKEQVIPLILSDIKKFNLSIRLDISSPDGDPGKFSINGQSARVIHRWDGFNVKINQSWFDNNYQLPEIKKSPFYWYVFALTKSNRDDIATSYFICDYKKMIEFVLDFDAPLGIDYQDQSYWNGNIYILDNNQSKGYFRWHDEDPGDLNKNNRFINLKNINEINASKSSSNLPHQKRNPNWTREEIILAMELYLTLGYIPTSENDEKIVELSYFLQTLPIHDLKFVRPNFRNPNGVYMKLMNLSSFDPNYSGKGLDAGSKLDKQVWDEFYGNLDKLQYAADSIRALC